MFRTFLMLVSIIALALPAGANGCLPTTSTPELDVAGFYIENDPCQPECMWSFWVYQESNGMDGLQRGDEVKDDTCGGVIEADTIVF